MSIALHIKSYVLISGVIHLSKFSPTGGMANTLGIRQQKHPCYQEFNRLLKNRSGILAARAGNSSGKQVKDLMPIHWIFDTKLKLRSKELDIKFSKLSNSRQ